MSAPSLADAQAASARIALLNVAQNFIQNQMTAAQADAVKWQTFDLAAAQAAAAARIAGIQSEADTTQAELVQTQAIVDAYNAANPVAPITAGADA